MRIFVITPGFVNIREGACDGTMFEGLCNQMMSGGARMSPEKPRAEEKALYVRLFAVHIEPHKL